MVIDIAIKWINPGFEPVTERKISNLTSSTVSLKRLLLSETSWNKEKMYTQNHDLFKITSAG